MSEQLLLWIFIAMNALRLLAYVPQIVQLWRDQRGAKGISCASWTMFTAANCSTALYALFVQNAHLPAFLFGLSTLGSFAILALTALRRLERRRVELADKLETKFAPYAYKFRRAEQA